MAEKVYVMVIKADLDCCRCYNKIRKVLCKTPGIQSQVFEVKQNTVTVTGSFDPLRLACKLQCKAGECISGIEIKESEKKPPKDPPKPPKDPPPKDPPKDTPPPPPPKDTPPKDPPKDTPPKDPPPPPPPKVPVVGLPVLVPVPVGICCRPCYMGYGLHYCENRAALPSLPPARDCCRRCSEGYEGHYCENRAALPPLPGRDCCRRCYEGYEGHYCENEGGNCNIM